MSQPTVPQWPADLSPRVYLMVATRIRTLMSHADPGERALLAALANACERRSADVVQESD
jgi:hypothetical protein